jgi:hypothetical protein
VMRADRSGVAAVTGADKSGVAAVTGEAAKRKCASRCRMNPSARRQPFGGHSLQQSHSASAFWPAWLASSQEPYSPFDSLIGSSWPPRWICHV